MTGQYGTSPAAPPQRFVARLVAGGLLIGAAVVALLLSFLVFNLPHRFDGFVEVTATIDQPEEDDVLDDIFRDTLGTVLVEYTLDGEDHTTLVDDPGTTGTITIEVDPDPGLLPFGRLPDSGFVVTMSWLTLFGGLGLAAFSGLLLVKTIKLRDREIRRRMYG